MSVKIRLQRHGRKRYPFYHIVIADSRAPRDGRFIEKLGIYNPNTNPATIELDADRALDWLQKGAQPTETVNRILSYKGVKYRKHLMRGVAKGVLSQEEADAKFADWMKEKANSIDSKMQGIQQSELEATQNRLAEEAKIAEERAKAIADRKAKELAEITATEEGDAAEAGDEANEENKPEA